MASTSGQNPADNPANTNDASVWKPPPGRLGNLTIPQQHTLDKLKKEMQAEGGVTYFFFPWHDDSVRSEYIVHGSVRVKESETVGLCFRDVVCIYAMSDA